MSIGIMVPDLSPHDAIGNDALGMYISLGNLGHDCRIFSLSGETRHPMRIHQYDDVNMFANSPDDILVYHYAVADPVAFRVLRKSPARVILKYHNLTPASFMAPYSKDFALDCKRARDALRTLCDLPLARALHDSDYNMADIAPLLPKGLPGATVAPMHRISELLGSPDDPETLSMLDQAWFNVLTVGRVVPNKAVDLMIPALARLRDTGVSGVRLHVAGGRYPRLQSYTDLIEGLIARHGLQADVVWHNAISASKLATLYRHCDVFWTASQHEGFCVPVAEAMAFELPVLSTRQGALPETCGKAALFADDTDEMARQLRQLATNDTLRAKLGALGGRRYRETYRLDILERKFLAEIDRVAGDDVAQAAEDGADWFGLPAAEIARIGESLPLGEVPMRLATADGRRNFVDWLVRGGNGGGAVVEFIRSDEMQAYARRLEVPEAAAHLTPGMRFAWHFNPFARSQFTLRSNWDVASFLAWYRECGARLYERVLPSPDGDARRPMTAAAVASSVSASSPRVRPELVVPPTGETSAMPGDLDTRTRENAPAVIGRETSLEVRAPVSLGELIDKISILEIKSERIAQSERLTNVRRELGLLRAELDRVLSPMPPEIASLSASLKRVNELIWDAEEVIHGPDAAALSEQVFLRQARVAFDQNDTRARLKRRINDLSGSTVVEEKSYPDFAGAGP